MTSRLQKYLETGKWASLIVLLFLSALVFLLYFPALKAYFVAEDLRHITFDWSEVADEFNAIGQSVGYRPGATLYLVVNNTLWGRNPAAHHAVVFCLHALTAWMVYLLVRRVTTEPFTALLAAVIFAVSPSHTEAVIWLSAAAGTVFSGLVCMLGVWVWVRRNEIPSIWTICLVSLLYFLALTIKEVAVVLPVFLLLVDWQVGRFSQKPWHILRYLPLLLPLGLYLFFHVRSGSLQSSLGYGLHLEAGYDRNIVVWATYARDFFRPFSPFLERLVGAGAWLWLALFLVLLHVVRRGRWGGYWAIAALAPAATAYGLRLTYLAVAGFAVLAAIALVDGTRAVESWLDAKTSSQKTRRLVHILALAGLGTVVLGWLLVSARSVRLVSAHWVEAGELAWSLPRQAKQLLPVPPEGSQLYFSDLPEYENGAYVLGWGINQEVQHVYGIPDLQVFHVITGAPRWGKLTLDSIPCEAEVPRYFFRYYAHLKELKQVSQEKFGVLCP